VQIKHTHGSQFIASSREHRVIIDQPVSAGGTDEGFTPPEMFIASLGSCIGVYVVDFCARHGIPNEGLSINMSWRQASDPPNRIGKIEADVRLPGEVSPAHKQAILRVAQACLIHNTISHSPQVEIRLNAEGPEG